MAVYFRQLTCLFCWFEQSPGIHCRDAEEKLYSGDSHTEAARTADHEILRVYRPGGMQ
jgi:hypothetical protein